jgi:hypothetical protein
MKTERRGKDRLEYVLPLKVRGRDEGGRTYSFKTVARDIGSGGLCGYAPRPVRIGERLSMRVRFAHPGSGAVQAPEISVRGRVVRVEQRPTGLCMFAVSFLISGAPGSCRLRQN